MHNQVLPWIARPIVTNNLVNGEEGMVMPAFPPPD
jgi:hypothetical protein